MAAKSLLALPGIALACLLLGCDPVAAWFSPDRPDRHGYTALMRAAEAGDVARIRELVEAGADPDYQGRTVERWTFLFPFHVTTQEDVPHRRWTPLFVAARAGRAAAVDALLDAGANPDRFGRDGTALQIAAERGDAAIVTRLLAAGADSSTRGVGQGIPLLEAVRRGHREAVAAFLDAGDRPRWHGDEVMEALLQAVRGGRLEEVRMLYAAGAVSLRRAVGFEREVVFLDAIGHGHFDVSSIPVDAIVDLPERLGTDRGEALLAALGRGDPGVVRDLVDAGIQLAEPIGAELMACAAAAGRPAVARALADAGADPNTSDWQGVTPLMRAAAADQGVGIAVLLELGADPAARDHRRGRTALMYAAEADAERAVDALLARGAVVDARDSWGWTAWMIATRAGHQRTADALRDAGADTGPQARTLEFLTALEAESPERVARALAAGAAADTHLESGYHPLALAVRKRSPELLRALLDGGSNPDGSPGVPGYWSTPLQTAAVMGEVALLRALLEAGAEPDLAPSSDSDAPLFAVVPTGNEASLRALIGAGADPSRPAGHGETPLARARRAGQHSPPGGDVPKLALLLEELGGALEPDAESPLVDAAVRGDPARLAQHLPHADRTSRDAALVAAASAGREAALASLLAAGAGPDARGLADRTALVAAADGGHLGVARSLLTAGADPMLADAHGTTPMEAAVRAGHDEVALLLRESGVPEEPDPEGSGPRP